MAIRIRLDDGTEIVLQATLEEWDKAFQKALTTNAALEVQLPDGSIKPINPREVESFREAAEDEAELREHLGQEATPA